VVRLVSITVAGAAPASDESSPDFPFQPFPRAAATAFGRARLNGHLTPREACLRPWHGVKGRAAGAAHGMIPHVGSTENGAGARRLDAAEWAGYLLVTPLVLCLAGVGLLPSYAAQEFAERAAIAWGAVLLAGAGAVHWGLALAGRLSPPRAGFGGALAAALAAAAGLLVGGQRGLALLVIGGGGFWLYEHRALGGQLPPAYLNLRRHVALASGLLLALIMFVSDAAGLG
jgi:Protein of unknown function (DUF3429)